MPNTKLLTILLLLVSLSGMAMTTPTPTSPINNVKVASFAVTLTVSNISTATGYQFEMDTVIAFNSPLHIKDTTKYYNYYVYDLKVGQKYFWRARAYKSGDTSAWSVISTFIDSIPTATNSQPANGSSGSIVKIYGYASGSTENTIYQYEADTTILFNSLLHTFKSGKADAFIDSNLFDYGRKIFWRMRAIGKYGDTTGWSPIWGYTITKAAIANSSSGGVLNTNPQYIHGWPTVYYAISGTEILLDTTTNFNSINLINHYQPAGVVRDTFNNLKFGKNYYYKIRNVFNGKYSDWSPTYAIKITPSVNFQTPSFNGLTGFTVTPTFYWSALQGSNSQFQFATDALFNNLLVDTSTSSSTYQYRSVLMFNTKYYIRVRAYHAVDTSVWTTYYFTTTNGKPYMYGITDKQANVIVRPHVYFRKETYAAKYIMEFDTGTVYTSQHSSWYIRTDSFTYDKSYYHFLDTSLAYNQQYVLRFTMIKDNDTSAPLIITFKTASAPVNYYPPNNFIGLGTSTNGLVTGIDGSTFIQWEIDSTPNFNSPLYAMGTDPHIKDDFTPQYVGVTLPDYLKFHTTYYWRTRCINPVDTGEWSSPFKFLTTQEIWLVSPADRSALQPANITLEWGIQGSTNYLRYQFMISKDSNFTGAPIITLPADSSSAAKVACNYNTTYYWKARAYNPVDTSHWSNVWRFTTAGPPAIGITTLLQPANKTINVPPGTVALYWATTLNANGYEVEVSDESTFAATLVSGSTTNTGVYFTGATTFKTYYWRVRGTFDLSTKGSWSNVYWFRTAPGTGIISNNINQVSEVFPNPADKDLNLIGYENSQVKFIDITGKVCLETINANGVIDVSKLPEGIYILEITRNSAVEFKKVSVKH